MSVFLAKIPYILAAILVFGVLIAIHELGHFLAAKLSDVQVNEFSIGMGPCLWKKQKGETQYSLRLLPIGGFCAMEGEGEESDSPRALGNQGFWKKLLIFAAGAGMNFLTGLLLIAILFAGAAGFYVDAVLGTAPELAAVAGESIQPGDRFYKVNGYRTYVYGDAQTYLAYAGDTAEVELVRDGEHIQLQLQKQTCSDQKGQPYQGFGLYLTAGLVESQGAGTWLRYVWYQTVDYVQLVWFSLRQLVTGGASMDDVGGPVAIVSTITDVGMQSQQQAEANDQNGTLAAIRSIASFAALIAVNLAVMNLLPIPALDGGHILFLILDTLAAKLFRRRIPPKYEAAISSVFLVALMGFMLFVTAHDIFKLIR